MAAMLAKDMKVLLRNRKIWFFALLMLLGVAVSAVSGSGGEAKAVLRLGITDLDDSEYSNLLVRFFEDNEIFSSYVSIVEGNEQEMSALFEAGEADMLLTIPKDFAMNLKHMNNTPIKALIDSSDVTKSVLFSNLLEAYGEYITAVEVNVMALYDTMKNEGREKDSINDLNEDISYDLLFTALGKDAFFKRTELERYQGLSLAKYYLYEAICLLILYIGLFSGMNLLSEQRSGGLLRLRTTGLTLYPIIGAKLFLFGVFGTLGLAAVMVADGLAGGDAFNAITFIMQLLFLFAVIALFFMISMLFRRLQTYLLVSNMGILLSCILGGGIIPLKYLPQALVRLAYITPNYWFARTMVQLQKGELDMKVIELGGIIILLAVVFFLFAGARRFEAGRISEV